MDCRKTLLVGLALVVGQAGCTTLTGPAGSESRVAAEKRVISENQAVQESQANERAGKKTPRAETFVAMAQFHESEAKQAQKEPMECNRLRDQARAAYQKAMELDPNNMEAHLYLARLYVTMGDDDRAGAVYKKALAKFPRESVFLFDLGLIQGKKKDWNGAIELLSKAREFDPENREVCTKLGLTLARAGRSEEAVACLTPYMGKAEACFTVARMMQHIGQPEASKHFLQVALQTNPELQSAQQMLAALEGRGPQVAVRIGFEQIEASDR